MTDRETIIDPVTRSRIARQIWDMWKKERPVNLPDGQWITEVECGRSGEKYLRYFFGLENFFCYVRKLAEPTILDIGAGTTLGISELSKSSLGEGLSFFATVLMMKPFEIGKNLGRERVRVTSAERLRGITDASIGGVLALQSICYSSAPDLALRQIDRVLVPGGILKSTFWGHWGNEHPERKYFPFLPVLKKMGYEIDTAENPEGYIDVVIAIKPGPRPIQTSAEELLAADSLSMDNQISILRGKDETR